MPRTAPLISSVFLEKDTTPYVVRKRSTSPVDESEEERTKNKGAMISIMQDANMDGVRHLNANSDCIRYTWAAIIVLFLILALVQICSQIAFYYRNPIATNIEAEYPSRIAFPTVAICNNNQFRLTYITGAWLLNRQSRGRGVRVNDSSESGENGDADSSLSIFDRVLLNAHDMDANRFLKNAAHSKTTMILGCTWPNGTACRLSDFRPVWTISGLCWAINSDFRNPHSVTGSGAGHGLRLLLNVESYERIEACSSDFRTSRLPGLRILIYNQTDVPVSSLKGVNVPAGYSMDIPFKMQHRHKLQSPSCREEGDKERESQPNFFSPHNIRTCTLRKYLTSIEESCRCSMRRSFEETSAPSASPTPSPSPSSSTPLSSCTVLQYFTCVTGVVERVREEGADAGCLPACDSIEYTAWQDMNRLPGNIMPPLIDDDEEDDESDVEETDFENELSMADYYSGKGEHLKCESNLYLDDKQVARIKRQAHRAYEKQSRYQEDVDLRTKRMITRLRITADKLSSIGWGWHPDQLVPVFSRLSNVSECFSRLANASESLARPPTSSEESRAARIHAVIDYASYKRDPHRFRTLSALKDHFGSQVEDILRQFNQILLTMEKLWTIYDEASYSNKINADLSRMDRIFELTKQYETGRLERRIWAEKMQSRQMKHFFEEEFADGWNQPIMRDLDQTLLKTIMDMESNEWPALSAALADGKAARIGALLFYGDDSNVNETRFREVIVEMAECALTDLKKHSVALLKEYKTAWRQFQSAYNNLFKKTLPEYLERYEFGNKFESDNFAMVNIFLHHMHLEHWRQHYTYSFWSLACDVGGALGLFVGASLLTLIEIVYLCFTHGFCTRKAKVKEAYSWVRHHSVRIVSPKSKRKKEEDSSAEDAPSSSGFPYQENETMEESRKRSIWNGPAAFSAISEEPSLADEDDPSLLKSVMSDESASALPSLLSPALSSSLSPPDNQQRSTNV